MKIIKYGYRKDNHTVIQMLKLDEHESLFNSLKGFIHEYEKGTKFSYIEDVESNPIDKEEAYKAIKKATTPTAK